MVLLVADKISALMLKNNVRSKCKIFYIICELHEEREIAKKVVISTTDRNAVIDLAKITEILVRPERFVGPSTDIVRY